MDRTYVLLRSSPWAIDIPLKFQTSESRHHEPSYIHLAILVLYKSHLPLALIRTILHGGHSFALPKIVDPINSITFRGPIIQTTQKHHSLSRTRDIIWTILASTPLLRNAYLHFSLTGGRCLIGVNIDLPLNIFSCMVLAIF